MAPREPLELEVFRQRLVALNRAPATCALYLATARRFLAWAGRDPGELESGELRVYLAWRQAAGVELWRRELYHLRALFGALVESGLVARDPTAGIRLDTRRAPTRRALSLAAIGALLAASGRPGRHPRAAELALRDRAALELLFAAGLRSSEASAVLVTDLDLRARELRVRPAKRGRPRTLPLPPAAVRHLVAYLRQARPTLARPQRDRGHLRRSRRGRPLHRSVLRELVVRAARGAQVHAYPHAIRRSLATALVRAGVPVPAVQHLLGHRSLAATQHYLDVDPDELRRTVELLAR